MYSQWWLARGGGRPSLERCSSAEDRGDGARRGSHPLHGGEYAPVQGPFHAWFAGFRWGGVKSSAQGSSKPPSFGAPCFVAPPHFPLATGIRYQEFKVACISGKFLNVSPKRNEQDVAMVCMVSALCAEFRWSCHELQIADCQPDTVRSDEESAAQRQYALPHGWSPGMDCFYDFPSFFTKTGFFVHLNRAKQQTKTIRRNGSQIVLFSTKQNKLIKWNFLSRLENSVTDYCCLSTGCVQLVGDEPRTEHVPVRR